MKKYIFGLLSLIFIQFQIVACTEPRSMTETEDNSSKGVVETLYVKHHKTIGIGESLQWCYWVKKSEAADWEYFYSPIEKWQYQWGHDYKLLVKKTTVKNPPMDGSSLRYELVKVLSDVAVVDGTTFEMPLGDESGNIWIDQEKKTILNEMPYTADVKITEKLRQASANKAVQKGFFMWNEKDKQLILKDVQ